MRAALYARVSTKNKDQNPETQLIQLREYARIRGYDVVSEYVDIGISGAKSSRPELNRLMQDARRRKIDAVVVWKFDRFGRSLQHLVTSLEEFRSLDIKFVSLTESVDTSTPIGQVMFAIIGAMAQFERDLIRERIYAGLDRARKEGKKLGPAYKIVDREKVRSVYQETRSLRVTAARCGIGKDLVQKIVSCAATGV